MNRHLYHERFMVLTIGCGSVNNMYTLFRKCEEHRVQSTIKEIVAFFLPSSNVVFGLYSMLFSFSEIESMRCGWDVVYHHRIRAKLQICDNHRLTSDELGILQRFNHCMMEEEANDGVDNFDDFGSAKHPCSKIFVRTVAVITCIHMIIRRRTTPLEDELLRCRTFSFIRSCAPNSELDGFADPDSDDIAHYVIRWVMFGSFPMLSLVAIFVTGALMKFWPRISQTMNFHPTLMHVLCLFSLFYMLLESLFETFANMYSISNSSSGVTAPWGAYLMSSLYTLLLWFFFLNFLVNMQLTEFDCRMAREVAGALDDDDVPAVN